MNRKSFLMTILVFSAAFTFARQGLMSGQKNLKLVQSKYFDIIYTEQSSRTAAILAKDADGLFEEIAGQFQLIYDFRLPVVITPAQDEFNAYYTAIPFNHIVMYDTMSPTSLDVYEDTFLEVFKHELTHAINSNLKNTFNHYTTMLFGDFYGPVAMVATTATLEGTAVEVESQKGLGRLNDPYAMHPVRQAKIENQFPKYSDIQTSNDYYPYGNQCYMFGGAFTRWLNEKYGREKYAQFWFKVANQKGLTYWTVFKSIYKISMKDAWDMFRNDLIVPETAADPKTDGRFNSSLNPSSLSLYTNLVSSDKGIYFYDSSKNYIYFSEYKDGGFKKPEKIFSNISIKNISVSKDGRFISIAEYDQNKAVTPVQIQIYDTLSKSMYTVKQQHLHSAVVFSDSGKTYLAAAKSSSQECTLQIYQLNFVSDRIKDTELVYEYTLPLQDKISSFTEDGQGTIYFIYKTGAKTVPCRFNLSEKKMIELPVPSDIRRITSLNLCSFNEGKATLSFSYAESGSLPRTGILEVKGNECTTTLQDKDISGGIFTPVVKDGNIIYIAQFYKANSIYETARETLSFAEPVTMTSLEEQAESLSVRKETDLSVLDSSVAYHGIRYFNNGTWLPVSFASSVYTTTSGTESQMYLPLGVTYFSTTPWSCPVWVLTAGYNPLTNSGGFAAVLNGGTDSSLFTYQLWNQVEFDSQGYKQFYSTNNASSYIYFDSMNYLVFSDDLNLFEGRQLQANMFSALQNADGLFNIFKSGDTKLFFITNSASVSFSNLVRNGMSSMQKKGFAVSAIITSVYSGLVEDAADDHYMYNNLALQVQASVPQLIPVENPTGFVVNQPFTFIAEMFPNQNYFGLAQGQLTLFSNEIQSSTNTCPLFYFNRFNVYAIYTAKLRSRTNDSWSFLDMPAYIDDFKNGSMKYSDKATLRTELVAMPNITSFASSLKFSLYLDFNYRFFPETSENNFDISLLGMTLFSK